MKHTFLMPSHMLHLCTAITFTFHKTQSEMVMGKGFSVPQDFITNNQE